jgi:hypothetical protein
MAVVWKYVAAGTFGGIMVGTSFISFAGMFVGKKKSRADLQDSVDHSVPMISETNNSEPEFMGNFKSDQTKEETSSYSFSQNLMYCSILCACLAIGNIRFYQMWKARHSNNRFDADAFQRGFERFMNEKSYENYKGSIRIDSSTLVGLN